MARRSASARTHVVVVPGFGGFDALGQMRYYVGITRLFEGRKRGRDTLHYFDNLPTAGVRTRARRLRTFLEKLQTRGDIAGQDDIVLVGHSTGGLDIRQLVLDLVADSAADKPMVDCDAVVETGELLRRIKRVVFLSVPHHGTNIADWVRSYGFWREVVVAELRASVAVSQVLLIEKLQGWLTDTAVGFVGTDLLVAMQDALDEAREDVGPKTPDRRAAAHEAAAELALYLRHVASDFGAIDDLTARHYRDQSVTPAHFGDTRRAQERQVWKRLGIDVLCFLTRGSRPFPFDKGAEAPVLERLAWVELPRLIAGTRENEGTDVAYRLFYRICAGGPFRAPQSRPRIESFKDKPVTGLEAWDNDGVVNTLSMPWHGAKNVLVECDHMDIVGHFERKKADAGTGRKWQAYNLLGSKDEFGPADFEKVWATVLEFCLGY